MAELARGTLADRPWGRTLGALGLHGLTGQLTLTADGKRYQIAFTDGAIVAATSPLATDAAVRIALTGGLVSSTQVADLARRQALAPDRDEIELLSELLRLAPDQSMRLRRRTIAQRAARTFSVDRGEFVVEDHISLPVVPGSGLDVRTVIYLGARQNLPELRLAGDLEQLGAWFRLHPAALDDLPQFAFTEAERPVLERLAEGATLEQLEALAGEVRITRAMIYALVSCNACEVAGAPAAPYDPNRRPARAQTPPPEPPGLDDSRPRRITSAPRSRSPTSQAPMTAAGPTTGRLRPPSAEPRPRSATGSLTPPVSDGAGPRPQIGAGSRPQVGIGAGSRPQIAIPVEDGAGSARPRSPTSQPLQPGGRVTPSSLVGALPRRAGPSANPVTNPVTGPVTGRLGPAARAPRRFANTPLAAEVRALIATRLKALDQGVDHFQLLGVQQGAPYDEIRKAYYALARQLHPDRLAALDIRDDSREAQRLFAHVNTAFTVLADPRRRDDYLSILRRGGEAVVRAEQAQAEAMALRILEGEKAFQRGDAALRGGQLATAIDELTRAVELAPDEVDHHAALAWAKFCAAHDKQLVGPQTRTTLERAVELAPRAISPRFYLGRVERILGRDAEALRHFQEVLRRSPNHQEAASEARIIEQRLGAAPRRG